MILPDIENFKNLPNLNTAGEHNIVESSVHDGMIRTREQHEPFTDECVHGVIGLSKDSWGD